MIDWVGNAFVARIFFGSRSKILLHRILFILNADWYSVHCEDIKAVYRQMGVFVVDRHSR